MNMLNNRLSVTADFYYDKTKDLIMTISDPEEPIYVGASCLPLIMERKMHGVLNFL